MTNRDTATQALDDIVSAFGLLTRLPLPQGRPFRGAASAWGWPVVGAVLGAGAALVATIATGLGLSAGAAAGLALAAMTLATGALHEDGLADTFDGLWGGHSKERRLEIMKDSRIGSYGVLALVLTVLLRWSALAGLVATGGHWAGLIAAGAISRAPMAVLMAVLPNARGAGLSQSVGAPSLRVAGLAVAVATVIGGLTLGLGLFAAVALALPAVLALAYVARARIGGQTGDILGASQQLADTLALTAIAAYLA